MDMISKEEYAKAIETIKEFESQRNLKYIESFTCVNCKEKEVTPTYPEDIVPWEQDKGNWDDGTVTKIQFGYGSRHDLKSYFLAVCDDCIEELEESGLVKDLKQFRKHVINNNTNGQ